MVRHTDIQTDRQTGRQAGRQTDRQTPSDKLGRNQADTWTDTEVDMRDDYTIYERR